METTSIRHPLARALLVLTFATGLVDAASFLGLGHVFTANMTGNLVLLGFGIAGSAGLPVVAPLVSLVAFLTGATLGGGMARSIQPRRPLHLSRHLAIEVAVLAAAALLSLLAGVGPNSPGSYGVIGLLAFAMGMRTATMRRIALPDLTTTVLTMTLTGLAADSPAAGGYGEGTVRRAAAIVAMLAGAIAGALLLQVHLALVLCVAALVPLLVLLLLVPAALAVEREGPSDSGPRRPARPPRRRSRG